jgi:hypothetical protein
MSTFERLFSYLLRAIVAVAAVLFALRVLHQEPWRVYPTDPTNRWAVAHAACYFVVAAIFALTPTRRFMAPLPFVAAIALVVLYVLALSTFSGGNDGGGAYWLVVVGSGCFLTCIAALAFSIYLALRSPKKNEDR